jgi:hypothetical protein
MKKLLAIGLALIAASTLWAQQEEYPRQAETAVSRAYHTAREKSTKPLFGVAKMEAIIKTLKRGDDDSMKMADAQYNALSPADKFVYCMLHGEDFTQNCSETGPMYQEERRIFGYIPGPFHDEEIWSNRQMSFMKNNRAQMVGWLRSTIQGRRHVGANIKAIIVELRLNELIPALETEYKRSRKDHDILSVLLILMKEGKYQPFLSSPMYKKLYGDQENYWASITATMANQRSILNMASAYFRSRTR